MMSGQQGTLVQKLPGWATLSIGLVLAAAHIAFCVLAVLVCPTLFIARTYEGSHCEAGGAVEMAGECGGSCLPRGPGHTVRLADIRMAFRFPGPGEQEQVGPWNWRLVGSLAVSLAFPANLSMEGSEQEMLLSASLDYAPTSLLAATAQPGTADCLSSSPWHNRASVSRGRRTAVCRPAGSPPASAWLCSLHPLFELHQLANASYTLQVRLEGTSQLLHSPATVNSQLALVRDTARYHQLAAYTRCLAAPLLLLALTWFTVRLCLTDLYIAIPDRLLMTAGLAQLAANVPAELVAANSPGQPLLVLLEPAAQLVLTASLALCWTVLALDKLADNEPWERTTRYYWRPLCLQLTVGLAAMLALLTTTIPPLIDPFSSAWQPGPPALLALATTALLALAAAAFLTMLCVMVCRAVCDISVRHPAARTPARLKAVLLYCLACATLHCLGWAARLAASLCLHWNQEVHTAPLPGYITLAGPLRLAEIASTNLHLVATLLLLSRARSHYTPVSPELYSPAHRPEQLTLWDLAARPSPLDR